ncbi:MAG TPA: hypothetical protein IAA10_12170 [Candidatus Blautia intestinavium]|nr:hypothetical protein [Candidatus Blautia intestinavium]
MTFYSEQYSKILPLSQELCSKEELRRAAIEREWGGLCMLEMTIEHLTGKEARELLYL